MQKVHIQNRKKQTMIVGLDILPNAKGLAFVAHGLSGFKEQLHLQAMAEAFFESNYSVVRWDSTNSLGESDGRMEDATVTSSYEDLEDVISWASSQSWFSEPFILAGHSLGGMSVALFAEKFSTRVKALAPISVTISGKLWRAQKDPKELSMWEKVGYVESVSYSKPGVLRRVGWNLMVDAMKYDLLSNANSLSMPVLMIVGEKDTSTPYVQQKLLLDAVPTSQKELRIIAGAEHTFRKPEELLQVKQLFLDWLKKF